MKPSVTRKNVEIFRAGDYGANGAYTPEMLARMADEYNTGQHVAPVSIDHIEGGPKFGEVIPGSVVVRGGSLFADLSLAPEFDAIVERGLYDNRSAELFYEFTPEGEPAPGQAFLRAVTFLGAQTPRVKGLEAIKFSATGTAGAVSICLDREDRNMKKPVQKKAAPAPAKAPAVAPKKFADASALGAFLRGVRRGKGLTLEALAEAAGMDIGAAAALETATSLDAETATKLAAALGISVEELAPFIGAASVAEIPAEIVDMGDGMTPPEDEPEDNVAAMSDTLKVFADQNAKLAERLAKLEAENLRLEREGAVKHFAERLSGLPDAIRASVSNALVALKFDKGVVKFGDKTKDAAEVITEEFAKIGGMLTGGRVSSDSDVAGHRNSNVAKFGDNYGNKNLTARAKEIAKAENINFDEACVRAAKEA